ncbi:aminoacyl-tRNA hydrolase [Acanthopleuribacter pedis]|uniref:Peptidyl-tRNA hydrolase n=1 Tax=Acanthopleuribacter pedis TaxID=442870 RepID=A0A8J7QKL5_9BACT|nr:aminoacyl-tRNA hydrolase [Acanthopleuribacter pedis]MBO1319943.1 aminoacyl-tRNA hydrolase [Acanthopleuribacter pedis]
MDIRLVVGLGNPGVDYEATRHNAGFLLMDRLIERNQAQRVEFSGICDLWTFQRDGQTVFLMKPLTYMNLSGDALVAFFERYSVPHEAILVAYDDIALPLGRLRIRPSGSAGGQKGMRHIIDTLQTSALPRLRIGIKTEALAHTPVVDYVLGRFSSDETPIMSRVLDIAADAVEAWFLSELAEVMNRYNKKAAEPLSP